MLFMGNQNKHRYAVYPQSICLESHFLSELCWDNLDCPNLLCYMGMAILYLCIMKIKGDI